MATAKARRASAAAAPRVLVIVPVRDEAQVLSGLLPAIHGTLSEAGYPDHTVVVVDDGSTDETAAAARRGGQAEGHTTSGPRVVLLEHPRALGFGRALRTGIAYVTRAAGPEDIVLMADATASPETLQPLIATLRAGVDVAVAVEGTRDHAGRWGADGVYGLLCPVPGLHHYASLPRGFRAGLLQEAVDRYGDEGFVTRADRDALPELLLKLRPLRPRVREVRVPASDMPRERGLLGPTHRIGRALALCGRATLSSLPWPAGVAPR